MRDEPAKMISTRLPTFLVIGAAKCGTTSLAAYLADHPQVFMARPKEVRFFTSHWARGVDWYAERFSTAPPDGARGEASPQYTNPLYSFVPERIASVIPDARLIYLVREPLAQIRSFHRHLVANGKERNRSLRRAVHEEPRYLGTASYGAQLARYLEYFDSEAILVLPSEELLSARDAALRSVFGHIGVDPSVTPRNVDEIHNTAKDKVALPRSLSVPRAIWRRSRGVTGRIPRRWRHSLRQRMGRPLPAEASELDSETADWVKEQLASDLELLHNLTNGTLRRCLAERWLAQG